MSGGRGGSPPWANLPTHPETPYFYHWPAAKLCDLAKLLRGGIQGVLAKGIKDRTRNNDDARQHWCISRWGLSWLVVGERNCATKWFGRFARHPVTQYRTCSVKNLVHLEISDKFSVFYRIIDFYAFFQTVAKRDLICRTIVYVYFILCMIARPKRFIKPKIMLMKSKLKTILIFVFQQIHFVFGHSRL